VARTVLIVDDEADVRMLVRLNLEARGFTVIQAEGGQQALDILLNSGPKIDVVLLDLNMPGMDGVEVLQQLRELEKPPPTAVVMFTAAELEDFRERVLPLGVRYWIKKPYEANELAATVERALEA
jgi:DNA-binding response OmpR family regulator